MKPGTLTHTFAVLMSSITSLFAQSAPVKGTPTNMKVSKKSDRLSDDVLLNVDSLVFAPRHLADPSPLKAGQRFPWKQQIVTTVFWIGEEPTANNPVPN